MRVGIGHDTHRLGQGGPLRLGGIDIPHDRHAVGHSDADVLLHAITDALLGAAALGDIGELFPDTDPANRGRDSAEMLRQAAAKRVRGRLPHRQPGLHRLCPAAEAEPAQGTRFASASPRSSALAPSQVGVKAKTGEGVGDRPRRSRSMAQCVALLEH